MNIRFEIEYRTIFGEDLFLNILNRDGSATPQAMHTRDGIIWSVQLEVTTAMEYYYTVTWEGREKRSEWVLCPHSFDPKEVSDPTVDAVQRDAWMDAPENFRIAGTLIPVFSLRSRRSFGVGDFGDLRQMVDWVAMTGQRILQILPINDTTNSHTWADSYPYSCISVFALHPQYVELGALPALKDEAARSRFDQLRQELNALPQLDYERVNAAKLEYLHLLFQQEGERMMNTPAYRTFFEENRDWLIPYAAFRAEKDAAASPSSTSPAASPSPAAVPCASALDPSAVSPSPAAVPCASAQVSFHYFVQYILSTQLAAVHAYARTRGVLLKGDIPIGVARDGCDVRQAPRYFNLNGQAGAPPDDFAVDGQNWGFPTYNWDEMLRDGCAWWQRRFHNMARYFDAYRIDHVLGFFRIWEIPVPMRSGLWGQFQPALALTREEIHAWGISEETRKATTAPIIRATPSPQPTAQPTPQATQPSPQPTAQSDSIALSANYLFLRDHKNPELFHPRIAAQKTEAYQQLSNHEQRAFDALYEDFFYHRNNQFWYEEAMLKLPKLVKATRMLCCAEDLGMVPACVGWVMDELGILSLEMESMPKEPWVRFGHVERNPKRSVATISSHDTPTLRMWWDEDYERTQDYYTNILHREGPAPHPLPGALARDIIQRHLDCPSMLCIISLQDWMAIDELLRNRDASAERINIPAVANHYWRYRMHVNIEDLRNDKAFTERIREMIVKGNR
ncbi:MAG: 4-alpha-glucanotransferase [Bacteroidaceae bacterium]|nr:4-alpha-glucanotransferase [Bacteroidaceae bacterium]